MCGAARCYGLCFWTTKAADRLLFCKKQVLLDSYSYYKTKEAASMLTVDRSKNQERSPWSTRFSIKLTSEGFCELKIPAMQVSVNLQSSNRAIFLIACLESTVESSAAWFSQISHRFSVYLKKISLLRSSPRAHDHVKQNSVQLQHTVAKFYGKVEQRC